MTLLLNRLKKIKYLTLIILLPKVVYSQFIIAGLIDSNGVYVDIADTTFAHNIPIHDPHYQNYFFDMNNDAVNDFKLTLYDKFWMGSVAATNEDKSVQITALVSNASIASKDTSYYCPVCPNNLRTNVVSLFNSGDTINESLNNFSNSAYIWYDNWSDIYYSDFGKHYIATKLTIIDSTILSWIQVDIRQDSITILDYYNKTEIPTSLTENVLSEINIYPNPSNGVINIDLGLMRKEINITIINSLGQNIYSNKYKNCKLIQLENEITEGVYFIKIESPEGYLKTIKHLKY